MIKTITVYSNGDSNLLTTWSNVPYLFCKALEKRGIIVNRVNIEANRFVNHIFNSFFYLVYRRLLRKKASPVFYRTWIHTYLTDRKIRKAQQKFGEPDLHLFLSYRILNRYTKRPNVLWCDWTDRIVIERIGREPQWYEKSSLDFEDSVVKGADSVYTMFPVCKSRMEELYGREFRYLERNVVNTVYEGDYDVASNSIIRAQSRKILFIGNHRYKGAALNLISVFRCLKKSMPDLELDIVGMSEKQLPEATKVEGCICHGYLMKDDKEQCEKYYILLLCAHVLVNPAEQWGAYSSTVEAMFYGCPVIISPYEDFVSNFGRDIEFGYYIDNSNKLDDLLGNVFSLSKSDYLKLCHNAHNVVKDYTWDNYVDCFLKDLKRINIC